MDKPIPPPKQATRLYEDTIESDIHREAEPLAKGCQNLHHPKNQKVTAAKTTFMLQQIMSHK